MTLDQYTIVEAGRTWQVFNWLQYFDHTDIIADLALNGFDAIEIISDFAESPGNGDGTHFSVYRKTCHLVPVPQSCRLSSILLIKPPGQKTLDLHNQFKFPTSY